MNKRNGFSLYLTFLVTSVLFILVTATYDISRISLDLGHSEGLEAIAYHAADGGLERGLGKLRQNFSPFILKYSSEISNNRMVMVMVECENEKNMMNLKSVARVAQGNKIITIKRLSRVGIRNVTGRNGNGRFLEAS